MTLVSFSEKKQWNTFFIECHKVKNMWLDIQKILNQKYNFMKTLSTYDILFGINEQQTRTVNEVNIITIQVKIHIWTAKVKKDA